MAENGRHRGEDALAAALAAGASVKDAAAQAGVSERTAFRRLSEIDFRRQVSQLRGQAVSQAAGRLTDAALSAVDVLRRLMEGADGEGVRLRAAVAILDAASQFREIDLEERLAALEEQLVKEGGKS